MIERRYFLKLSAAGVACLLLYVLDHGNSRVQAYSRAGKHLREIGCLGGGPDELRKPRDHKLDREGRLWVADKLNHRIQVLDLLGKGLARFRTPGDGLGQLDSPCALAFAPDGARDGGRERQLRARFAAGRAAIPQQLSFTPDRELHVDAQRATLRGSHGA
jgi:hypothetical protein